MISLNTPLSLSLACLIAALSQQALATTTLNFTGNTGTLIAGSGSASDLQVGDSVLLTNLSTTTTAGATPAPGFDAILTLNAIGGTGGFNASFGSATSAFLRAENSGGASTINTFGSFTLSFIELGSSTTANPFGNAVNLTGISAFTAQDIDSSGANLSDVFGFALTGQETGTTRGSALTNEGFINTPGVPTSGFDFSRVNENSNGTMPPTGADLDFSDESDSATTDPNNQVVYSFNNASLSSVDFIFGATSPDSTINSGNRGVVANIQFVGVAPVPEPSTSLLSLIAVAGSLLTRRRRS